MVDQLLEDQTDRLERFLLTRLAWKGRLLVYRFKLYFLRSSVPAYFLSLSYYGV